MPHQNVTASKATAQNAATDPRAPNDKGVEENDAVRPEARSYAAPDYRDASLAAPAAGEMGDYADEGEALATTACNRAAPTPTARSGQRPAAARVPRPSRPTATSCAVGTEPFRAPAGRDLTSA